MHRGVDNSNTRFPLYHDLPLSEHHKCLRRQMQRILQVPPEFRHSAAASLLLPSTVRDKLRMLCRTHMRAKAMCMEPEITEFAVHLGIGTARRQMQNGPLGPGPVYAAGKMGSVHCNLHPHFAHFAPQ